MAELQLVNITEMSQMIGSGVDHMIMRMKMQNTKTNCKSFVLEHLTFSVLNLLVGREGGSSFRKV